MEEKEKKATNNSSKGNTQKSSEVKKASTPKKNDEGPKNVEKKEIIINETENNNQKNVNNSNVVNNKNIKYNTKAKKEFLIILIPLIVLFGIFFIAFVGIIFLILLLGEDGIIYEERYYYENNNYIVFYSDYTCEMGSISAGKSNGICTYSVDDDITVDYKFEYLNELYEFTYYYNVIDEYNIELYASSYLDEDYTFNNIWSIRGHGLKTNNQDFDHYNY